MVNTQSQPDVGTLALLIGPSGTGKSTILKELKARHPGIVFPKSVTTRQRRPGEGDDIYDFVSQEEFEALVRDDGLIEYAQVHGAAYYGTSKKEIVPHLEAGRKVVREVDVQGLEKIRAHALFSPAETARFKLASIFVLPESKEILLKRITGRAPMSDEEIARRMASMEKELKFAESCDHAITNIEGRISETCAKIEYILGIESIGG